MPRQSSRTDTAIDRTQDTPTGEASGTAATAPGKPSLLYSYPLLYHGVMCALYGVYHRARFRAVRDAIPAGSRVVDVCAADCRLYTGYLRGHVSSYVGLDLSTRFVEAARRRGVDARVFDAATDEIPAADVVVMQASLYQFLPDAAPVLARLIAAARVRAVVAEPVRNLSDSRFGALAAFAQRVTTPGAQSHEYTGQRFDETSLTRLFESFPEFEGATIVPGGREMIGLFRGGNRA